MEKIPDVLGVFAAHLVSPLSDSRKCEWICEEGGKTGSDETRVIEISKRTPKFTTAATQIWMVVRVLCWSLFQRYTRDDFSWEPYPRTIYGSIQAIHKFHV